jgi:DNA-binding MarR family transcriptional regulator
MPLKGNLAVFTTTQLLNLINLSKRTGLLTIFEGVDTGEKLTLGDGETQISKLAPGRSLARLAFREGKLIYAEMEGKDGHLAGILHRAGKLNEEQSRLIRQRAEARNINDKGLALSLINANYVTRDDIVQSIRKHTVSIVFDLMTWKREPFQFDEGANPPPNRILVGIDLKNVIIEGTRIMNEQVELEREIPNLDLALRFTEDPSSLRGVKLGANEWRVVGFINPKNSIRQIAKACNMTDTEIRRIIYSLLQAGLVSLVKPQSPEKRRPTPVKKSAPDRDVVNRLIGKLKSIKAPSTS